MKNCLFILFMLALFILDACNGQKKNNAASPPGYMLDKPEKFFMPAILDEISGITLYNGHADTIYAEQDEEGRVFRFVPGNNQVSSCKFAKKGDYEDIAICREWIILLRSDGILYSFPVSETANEKAENVKEWAGLLPAGEYEGLYADAGQGKLYVLCKHCSDEKKTAELQGYVFTLDNNGIIAASGSFQLNVRGIELASGQTNIRFHPSALTFNSFTKEWFILSSVNKMLVVAGQDWKVKSVYTLPAALFPQPEGIAIDDKRSLYISNERGATSAGTIFKFAYHVP